MRHLIVPCLLLSVLAACGRSTQQSQQGAAPASAEGAKTAPDRAQGVRGTASGLEQTKQDLAQGARQAPQQTATAVDFEELKVLIPDVDGWTKSDVKGEELSSPLAYSRAQARYRRNDSRVELEITDTALSQLLLAPLSVFLASGYAERSDDGFRRAIRVEGQPAMEDWNARSSRGEVTALVANRFVVKAVGHDIDAIDPVRRVVEAVDFSSLAAIK